MLKYILKSNHISHWNCNLLHKTNHYHKFNNINKINKQNLSHVVTNTTKYLFPDEDVTFLDMTNINTNINVNVSENINTNVTENNIYNDMNTPPISVPVLHHQLYLVLQKLNKISPTIIQYHSFSTLMKLSMNKSNNNNDNNSNSNTGSNTNPSSNYHSVLLAGETGCGKTLAYVLPILNTILHEIDNNRDNRDNRDSNNTNKTKPTRAILMVPNNQLYSVVGEILELLNSCFGYKLTIGRSVNEVCMDMGCMYYTIYIIYIYILYSTQYTLHTNHTPLPCNNI